VHSPGLASRDGTPLFSIVIPCYNRASTIAPTIRSCLEQTEASFEVLIVDDGSTDNLEAVVASLKDPRVRYLRQDNGGGGKARNTGILASRGRYVAFLDSDDFFLPDKLARVREHIERTKSRLIYSYVNVDRGPGRTWVKPSRPIGFGEDVGEYLFVNGGLIQTSAMVVERVLATSVLFDPSLSKGQDLDFCVRLGLQGEPFTCIPEPLTIWVDRTHKGRTSHTKGAHAPLAWLEKKGSLLTPKALLGYRATVLSYYLAREAPITAACDILGASTKLGFGVTKTAQLLARAYVPQRLYRAAVDAAVGVISARQPKKRTPAIS
jgi:glycosyltransferase involved in cell wall biosynthesis